MKSQFLALLLPACLCAGLFSSARAETLATIDPVVEPVSTDSYDYDRGAARFSTQKSSAAPLVATVQLSAGSTSLRGQLLSIPQISVTTSFGEIDVPLSEVAGIKLASEGNPTTTVVLHNGDSITGACDISGLELKTEWGIAKIQNVGITSILFIEGVSWVADDGLGGTRWLLMEKRGEKAGTRQIKEGDRVVVTSDTDLRYGSRSVGKVRKGDTFTVEQLDGSYFYVTGDQNRTGWIEISKAERLD